MLIKSITIKSNFSLFVVIEYKHQLLSKNKINRRLLFFHDISFIIISILTFMTNKITSLQIIFILFFYLFLLSVSKSFKLVVTYIKIRKISLFNWNSFTIRLIAIMFFLFSFIIKVIIFLTLFLFLFVLEET